MPPERVVDPGGRDGCRAPIPWTPEPDHGWGTDRSLAPLAARRRDARRRASRRADDGSILHLYRRAARRAAGQPGAVASARRSCSTPPTACWPGTAPSGDDRRRLLVNFTGQPVAGRRPRRRLDRGASPATAAPRGGAARRRRDLRPDQAVVLGPGLDRRSSRTRLPLPSKARAASPSTRRRMLLADQLGPPAHGEAGAGIAGEQRLDVGPGGHQRGLDLEVARQLADPGRHQRRPPAAARGRGRRWCPRAGRRLWPRPASTAASTASPTLPLAWRSSTPRMRRRSSSVFGLALGDADHGEVGEDEPHRLVQLGGAALAPGGDRPGDGGHLAPAACGPP